MTGVELLLLLIGSIFMVGSFFITEKLSPSELNKIAELSEGELKKMIERGLLDAGARIEDAIDEQIAASSDKVDRALEKETNEKIMAISEYSDTVIEGMNKTHNEIMFLYSMLNDKHAELTGMVSDLQRLAADVRNLEENLPQMTPPATQAQMPVRTPIQRERPVKAAETPAGAVKASLVNAGGVKADRAQIGSQDKKAPEGQSAQAAEEADKNRIHKEILALHKEGLTEIQIARKMKMGIGEVRLVIGLYRGE